MGFIALGIVWWRSGCCYLYLELERIARNESYRRAESIQTWRVGSLGRTQRSHYCTSSHKEAQHSCKRWHGWTNFLVGHAAKLVQKGNGYAEVIQKRYLFTWLERWTELHLFCRSGSRCVCMESICRSAHLSAKRPYTFPRRYQVHTTYTADYNSRYLRYVQNLGYPHAYANSDFQHSYLRFELLRCKLSRIWVKGCRKKGYSRS